MTISDNQPDIEKVRLITDFMRKLANEIDQRGIASLKANNFLEQIEINTGGTLKEYRVGPHMMFQLELDWQDILPEGEDNRDVHRVM